MTKILINELPARPQTAAKMPPKPTCELCSGCGYLLPNGMSKPVPFDWDAIVMNALPCGCDMGRWYRGFAAEYAEPVIHRDGKTVVKKALVLPWE